MNFINPIEVLDLSKNEISTIDSILIKKAKRRVLADIELSDNGLYNYANAEYTKSDIEVAIDLLDNPEKLEFYHFIANNDKLNTFLKTGNTLFIQTFRQESIYHLSGFVQFISRHYATSFDSFLIKTYKDGDIELLKSAFQIPELFTLTDRIIAYRSLESFIKNAINDIDDVTKGLREGNTSETEISITRTAARFESLFKAEKLKLLPIYFQPLKNQAAQSLRNLSVQIYNYFSLTNLAFLVISHALKIGLDGLTEQKIQEDFLTIQKLDQDRIEQEKFAPVFKQYIPIVNKLLDLKEKLNNKTLKPTQTVLQIDAIELKGLNTTPDALVEVRDQIALALRSISVDVWNNYNDIQSAIAIIKISASINTSSDTKQNIIKAQQDLKVLYEKHKHELFCFFCEKSSPVEVSVYKKTVYKETYRRYKKVEYSYKEIAVPRCSSCSEIHTQGNNTKSLYTISIGILGAVLGYFADEHFIIGGILGIIGGLLLGSNQSEEAIKNKKIKTVSTVSQFPPISELLRNGWSFNKPSA